MEKINEGGKLGNTHGTLCPNCDVKKLEFEIVDENLFNSDGKLFGVVEILRCKKCRTFLSFIRHKHAPKPVPRQTREPVIQKFKRD